MYVCMYVCMYVYIYIYVLHESVVNVVHGLTITLLQTAGTSSQIRVLHLTNPPMLHLHACLRTRSVNDRNTCRSHR